MDQSIGRCRGFHGNKYANVELVGESKTTPGQYIVYKDRVQNFLYSNTKPVVSADFVDRLRECLESANTIVEKSSGDGFHADGTWNGANDVDFGASFDEEGRSEISPAQMPRVKSLSPPLSIESNVDNSSRDTVDLIHELQNSAHSVPSLKTSSGPKLVAVVQKAGRKSNQETDGVTVSNDHREMPTLDAAKKMKTANNVEDSSQNAKIDTETFVQDEIQNDRPWSASSTKRPWSATSHRKEASKSRLKLSHKPIINDALWKYSNSATKRKPLRGLTKSPNCSRFGGHQNKGSGGEARRRQRVTCSRLSKSKYVVQRHDRGHLEASNKTTSILLGPSSFESAKARTKAVLKEVAMSPIKIKQSSNKWKLNDPDRQKKKLNLSTSKVMYGYSLPKLAKQVQHDFARRVKREQIMGQSLDGEGSIIEALESLYPVPEFTLEQFVSERDFKSYQDSGELPDF